MSFKSESLEGHSKEWAAQIDARESDSDFLSYFDTAASADEAYRQGFWDFSYHILKPKLLRLIGEPHNLKSLEIGFGGGRLINAASRYFNHAYGVDIHESFDRVQELLSQHDANNVTLLKGDGDNIPIGDSEIDLVYSFIVFQHLPFIEVLEAYLAESYRVLKPGGAAILYFGHLDKFSRHSYRDLKTSSIVSSRENSLIMKAGKARSLVKGHGFKIIECERSTKKPWTSSLGQQNFIIAQK